MTYCVYIVYSASLDVYYKGFTSRIDLRLNQHLKGESYYTSRAKDWQLKFVREFDNKTKAIHYESMLKRQNRKYILWAIQQEYNVSEKYKE